MKLYYSSDIQDDPHSMANVIMLIGQYIFVLGRTLNAALEENREAQKIARQRKYKRNKTKSI